MPFKTWAPFDVLTAGDVNTYLMQQVIIRCTSTTRPLSPGEGWHIYETDTGKFLVYKAGAWVPQGLDRLMATKTNDELVGNSITYQDDDHLFLPVEANSTYRFEMYLWVTSSAAGDFKMCFTGPTNTNIFFSVLGYQIGATTDSQLKMPTFQWFNLSGGAGAGFTEFGCGVGAFSPIWFKGTLVTSAAPGTLRLQWAQNAANATATILKQGSWMSLEKF
ncbi:hypothetical protein HNP84_007318 [Thermocatellispora tengchongensis]|uniref:Uncharacterized protein n=1 Tax=Thermocatellispora tengchongensis TaxID=1073253 RepID=A0A840PFL7_9ACTN|nr:hypothetical protein [Thermocatellispora tengchongensis]MBB5137566.1 hypothetical protein [Thermocatellispora tengchongensis]